MIKIKHLVTALLLFSLTISCNEDLKVVPKKPIEKISKTSLDKEKHLESVLNFAGFSNTLPNGQKSGRSNNTGFQIDTEKILKIIQADSIHYTYTFRIEDDFSDHSFSNLVIEEIDNGYIGFVIQYESVDRFSDLASFTGTIRRFDLLGAMISEINLIDGTLDDQTSTSTSGRTALADGNCVRDIIVKDVCTKWGNIYNYNNSQTTGFGCLEYETVIEIVLAPCPGAGGGDTGSGGDTGGTYIPPSTGSGGTSGSGGSSSNPPYSGDPGGGAGGVTPTPKPIVVLPEDQAYSQRVSDFKSGLSSAQLLYLKKNQTSANGIYTYLENQVDVITDTEYSSEATAFVTELLDLAILQNNTELSNKLISIALKTKPLGTLTNL